LGSRTLREEVQIPVILRWLVIFSLVAANGDPSIPLAGSAVRSLGEPGSRREVVYAL
jgi:hypothetical protein